jgi:formylglycine-generating enzyme required for sulfatase activity
MSHIPAFPTLIRRKLTMIGANCRRPGGASAFRRTWIARYEAEFARSRPAATAAEPGGTFGTNSNGLDDVAGNVWEWTNSCFVRVSLDGERERITNCGVRVVEGAHRSYVTDFIRDPRSGGCAAGVPPANLGFRLVAEPSRSVATSVVRNVTKLLRRA